MKNIRIGDLTNVAKTSPEEVMLAEKRIIFSCPNSLNWTEPHGYRQEILKVFNTDKIADRITMVIEKKGVNQSQDVGKENDLKYLVERLI